MSGSDVRRRSQLGREHLSDDRGVTLVELMVVTAILGIVLLVFTTTLSSIQRAQSREDVLGRQVNEARLAVRSIDREMRSASSLKDPDSETGTPFFGVSSRGYLLRAFTAARIGTSDTSGHCAMWFVDSQRRLQFRRWPANTPGSATPWRVIAEGIVNRDLGTPPFALEEGGRTVSVNLLVNPDIARNASMTQPVEASVTGRNISPLGYWGPECQSLPS